VDQLSINVLSVFWWSGSLYVVVKSSNYFCRCLPRTRWVGGTIECSRTWVFWDIVISWSEGFGQWQQ